MSIPNNGNGENAGCSDRPIYGLGDQEARTGDFLPLARLACHRFGAASQTFAAMQRAGELGASRVDVFLSIAKLADLACLPRRTVQSHLRALVEMQAIAALGREQSTAVPGRKRRTATYRIDQSLHRSLSRGGFNPLPRWAAKILPTWGERCIFAAIVSRATMIEALEQGGGNLDGRDTIDGAELRKLTGLSNKTVGLAKSALAERGLIVIERGPLATMASTIRLDSEYLVDVGIGWRPNGRRAVNGTPKSDV